MCKGMGGLNITSLNTYSTRADNFQKLQLSLQLAGKPAIWKVSSVSVSAHNLRGGKAHKFCKCEKLAYYLSLVLFTSLILTSLFPGGNVSIEKKELHSQMCFK